MRAWSLFVTLLLCAAPRAAHSEPDPTTTTDAKGEARRYFQAGVSLQKTDDFDAAIDAYTTSLDFYTTKSALFNLANCQRAMHRYADAWHSLHRLHAEFGAELGEPMLSTSKAQLAELENLTGLVTLETRPSGATLTLDGKPLGTTPLTAPVRVTIGAHTIQASLEGYTAKDSTFKLSPKQALTLAIELTEAQPPQDTTTPGATPVSPTVPPQDNTPATSAPNTTLKANAPAKAQPKTDNEPSGPSAAWRAAGWVGIALGGAAIAVGARSGLRALDVDDSLKQACEGSHCSVRYAGNIERLERLSTSANVFIGVGAAVLATGATLVLWPASTTETKEVTLTFSPTAVKIGGRF